MVSAISICFLVGVVNVVSSQTTSLPYTSALTEHAPISERRTLGHFKSNKRIPIIKKHKKFGGWRHNNFGKTEFTPVPIHDEFHPSFYKFHRHHGIDLQPVVDSTSTLSISPLEFSPESHSFAPFAPPEFNYFSSSTPKHEFYHFHLPANEPIIEQISSPLPIKTSITSIPSIPPPVTFIKHPEPIQQFGHVFPSLPLPPAHSLPIAPFPLTPSPILPPLKFASPLILPTSAPFFQSPIALPQISTPTPILENFPSKDSFPTPSFGFQPISVSSIAPPAINFPSSTTAEPELPYPPSGTPIPSHIKDISLTDHLPEVPQSAPEINIAEKDISKHVSPVLSTSKPDAGLFNKVKGWKAQTANAAFNHLNKFNKFQQPLAATHPTVSDKIPSTNPVSNLMNPYLPIFPSLPFQVPSISSSKPSQGYFSMPLQNSLPPFKYEHFPPNAESTPPLLNSYGVPISHDTYAPPRQSSHDRVSPAASEEKPSVLPPPPSFTEETPKQSLLNNEQNQATEEPSTSQSLLEFQTKNFRPYLPSSEVVFKEHPVYISDNTENFQNGNKQTEEVSQLHRNKNLEENNVTEKEQDLINPPNHKEE